MFSRAGYEGAVLRDIARDAEVSLSTIHLYFGSKSELFAAVGQKAWSEIDRERSAHLDKVLSESVEAPPPLEGLIYALAFPIVRRALSDRDRDVAQVYILRNHMSHWQPHIDSGALERADQSIVRWVDAMRLSCPSLSHQDAVWAFSFVVGVIYSWQLIDHRYDRMIGADLGRTPDGVGGDLVSFCASGVRALAERRSREQAGA